MGKSAAPIMKWIIMPSQRAEPGSDRNMVPSIVAMSIFGIPIRGAAYISMVIAAVARSPAINSFFTVHLLQEVFSFTHGTPVRRKKIQAGLPLFREKARMSPSAGDWCLIDDELLAAGRWKMSRRIDAGPPRCEFDPDKVVF